MNRKWLLTICTYLLLGCLTLWSTVSKANASIPLPPEQAFAFSATLDSSNKLTAEWKIAPGYYLYRDKFKFTFNPDVKVQIFFPPSEFKHVKKNSQQEVYSGNLQLPFTLPVSANTVEMTVSFQGCSQSGFCYPPMEKKLRVNVVNHTITLLVMKKPALSLRNLLTNQNKVISILNTSSTSLLLFIFLMLGLLLAFTPCIFPMVPILTSIIVGHKQPVTTKRAFALSATYVVGMAIAYALAGIVVAALGETIQVWLQNPWMLGFGSMVFVVLATSMFGLFDLRLPRYWHNYVAYWSYEQQGGSYIGVFLMGVLSTLIVSPCVTAPLVGVLLYIAQTGDLWLGASALFVMGIGMGIPLLAVGMSAGKWLPKSGPWMEAVKKSFGFVMMGMAIWLLMRVLPPVAIQFLWNLLIVGIAYFLGVYVPQALGHRLLPRVSALLILAIGIMVTDFNMSSFNILNKHHALDNLITFKTVKDIDQINDSIAAAHQSNQPVVLDFYADWCESCVSMDKRVFNQATIRQAMSGFVLLRVDLSQNTAADQEILKHFNVIAPPTMLFFDRQGAEVDDRRVVGELSARELLSRINAFYAEGCDKKASC